MSEGFVYFLDNEAMPGLIKIGYSSRHPAQRVRELSSSTSCPVQFRLLGWFSHGYARWVEGELHKNLAEYRYSENREFFKLTYAHVQDLMRQWGDPHEEAFVDSMINYLVNIDEGRG